MKPTAVEFLEKICNDRGYHLMEKYFEQAKQMELAQRIEDYNNGHIDRQKSIIKRLCSSTDYISKRNL